MKLSTLLYFFALCSPVFGGGYSSEVCRTLVGTKSVHPVPRNTKTVTVTSTAIKKTTIYPSVVITPTVSSTTTSTITRTTTKTILGIPTITTYSTVGTTTTTTSTVQTTTTSISTTTSTGPATTVPTPAGFTPVRLTDNRFLARRDRSLGYAPRRGLANRGAGLQVRGGNGQHKTYPTAVSCTKTVVTTVTSTSTVRGKTTTTITGPASTSVITATTTTTTTVTTNVLNLPITITLTTTTTSTVGSTTTQTATTTSTVTETVPPPEPTSYAICNDENNFASHFNEGGTTRILLQVYFESAFATYSNIASARACCNLCAAAAPGCGGSFWALNGACTLISDQGTCAPATIRGYAEPCCFPETRDPDRVFISNGPCGRIVQGGN